MREVEGWRDRRGRVWTPQQSASNTSTEIVPPLLPSGVVSGDGHSGIGREGRRGAGMTQCVIDRESKVVGGRISLVEGQTEKKNL